MVRKLDALTTTYLFTAFIHATKKLFFSHSFLLLAAKVIKNFETTNN